MINVRVLNKQGVGVLVLEWDVRVKLTDGGRIIQGEGLGQLSKYQRKEYAFRKGY